MCVYVCVFRGRGADGFGLTERNSQSSRSCYGEDKAAFVSLATQLFLFMLEEKNLQRQTSASIHQNAPCQSPDGADGGNIVLNVTVAVIMSCPLMNSELFHLSGSFGRAGHNRLL